MGMDGLRGRMVDAGRAPPAPRRAPAAAGRWRIARPARGASPVPCRGVGGPRRRRPSAGRLWQAAVGVVALAPVATLAQDVAGSRDPAGIARYPGAWIVEYSEHTADAALPYQFITAPVDKIRRDVRVEATRVTGPLRRVTYRVPDGARLADVIAHYERVTEAAGASIAFTCRGPDCGRSTIWANDVFGVAELNAPVRNQFYQAAALPVDGGQRLAAIYVVQRGNRRIYAHVDMVIPDDPVPMAAAGTLADALARDGHAIVPGVAPDASGGLDAEGLASLAEAAAALDAGLARGLHVVCHLYGPGPVRELLAAAERCAATAATVLAEAGVTATPHGIGPLAPAAGARARIELVLPDRLRGR